jgi:hypothetical protein
MSTKKWGLIYLSVFLLCGAAPIALNPGGGSFNGGTLTNVLLAPDGATGGPAYSHSAEPGMGLWRSAANTLSAGAQNGYWLDFTATANNSNVKWDSGFTDVSTSTSAPAIRGTDADTGVISQSRATDFVWNGDAFAGIRSSGVGSYYGGMCLDASGTAPCINNYLLSGGKFILSSVNVSNWTGFIDLGDDGSIISDRNSASNAGYAFENDSDTGIYGSSASSITFGGGGVGKLAFSTSSTSFSNISGHYVYVSLVAGAPPAGDCDADEERGRLVLDTTNSRLYVCGGATRLWDYYSLI